jgi:hypothetical protein
VITPESVNVGPTEVFGTFGTVGAVGEDRGSLPHALITSNIHSPAARRMMASISLFSDERIWCRFPNITLDELFL